MLSALNDPSPAVADEEQLRSSLAAIPIEGRPADPRELGRPGRARADRARVGGGGAAIGGATLEAVAGAFLTTAAQVASVELAERGITANVVVPALEPDAQAVQAVVDFLVSNAAQGVTDAVIAADGGFSITKASEPNPLLDARSP